MTELFNENKEKDVSIEEGKLAKIVSPEGEFEIPIGNGNKKKVFWSRIGFDSRVYFKAYFKKQLKEAIKNGFIDIDGHYHGAPVGDVDGKNTIYTFSPSSLEESTLKVFTGNKQLKSGTEYNYSSDMRVLFFNDATLKDITVDYDYYDLEIYEQLFNNCFIKCMIYLCAKELEDHNKAVFSSLGAVGQLSLQDVNDIFALHLTPGEKDLKN